MSSPSRRLIAGLVRIGLVILAAVVIAGYVSRRTSRHGRLHVETTPPPDSLGPGDLRIYNADSTIDLVLKGDQILAGLSPKMVEKIKAKLDTSESGDTSGFAGSIGSMVKKSVSSAIGTHAAVALTDVRDVRYDGREIVFEWTDGREHQLFQNANVNGERASRSFRAEDANKFVAAVRARKAATPTSR
jgi:hypothetical protein